MSLKPLLSFSSGELDPILTDNVTLEKFNKGLTTARNVMIGKTGAILSRFSRRLVIQAKSTNKAIKIYQPPNTEYLLEFGDLYLRVHYNISITGSTYVELVTTYTSDEALTLHFTTSQDYVYIFCSGKKMRKLYLNFLTSAFVAEADIFKVPNPLHTISITATGAPAGYKVDYLCSLVINGEESVAFDSLTSYPTGVNKPIAAGQSNAITAAWLASGVVFAEVSEMRVYSRPAGGGAYGFLGSTTAFGTSGLNKIATYTDIGNVPDYGNGTQDLITKYGLGGDAIIDLKPRTGTVYQQRLLLTTEDDKEALLASRPGFKNNFYRDFPYASDSALLFKAGTSGKAFVLRIIESDGIVVFTTNGVYTNSGLLGISNIALERRGGWIIDPDLPPLVVPGGLFFVDTSNTIRQLIFSQEILAYESVEQTIFSNHLFTTRKITSWCYQTGTAPLIIVTFSDGTFAAFTYNFEHQMKAWTRHDSKYPVEQVEGTVEYDKSYFVTNKNGAREIEMSLPRYIPVETFTTDREADMKAPMMFADSIREQAFLAQEEFTPDQTLVPVTPGDWSGQLSMTYPDEGSGPYSAWTTLRFFHPVNKNIIDLTVVSSTGTETIFEPSEEFPSEYAVGPNLYTISNTMTGLSHLEGESVAVMVDGALVASPYNDVEGLSTVTVTGGSISLPNGMLGAIIVVGRPIAADIKTLNVSTVEQSPTLLESINVNKMYVRVKDSRGLYVSNNFPEEKNDEKDGTSVQDMESLDEALVPEYADLIGNRGFQPVSKRCEVTVRGDWRNQGQVAIRQVDPLHFQILSIIPDITVLKRSDR